NEGGETDMRRVPVRLAFVSPCVGSRFGGIATIVPGSDYVSTCRGDGRRSAMSLPCIPAIRELNSHVHPSHKTFGVSGSTLHNVGVRRRGSLAVYSSGNPTRAHGAMGKRVRNRHQ